MQRITLFMAMIAVLLLSCGKSKESIKSEKNLLIQDFGIASATTDSVSISKEDFKKEEPQNTPPKAPEKIDWDKKIIKTSDIALQVKDYTTFNNDIHKNIKNYGAYIASEEQSQTDGGIQNSMSIKVPVDQFENLLNSLNSASVTIVQKKINTQDVSGEVVDTKARIEAKKQVRNRYMDLLKQAKNMKEILEVQQEINSIQEGIESGTSRVSYLTHNAAYSTINLRYFQDSSGSNTMDENPGFFAKFKESFSQGVNIISNLLLFFISLWPFIIFVFIGWFIYRKIQPKKSKN